MYFGSENPPPQVLSGITDSTFVPGTLEYDTEYFWKIVAHDNQGNTTEGDIWSFSTLIVPEWQCGELLVDNRDDHDYTTVQIGEQCWMAENLNIGIQIINSQNSEDNDIIEKHCYDNNVIYCDVYGGMYQWDEMMNYSSAEGLQGICPNGWHIPTDNEWKILEGFVDSQNGIGSTLWDDESCRGFDVGFNLKSTNGWFENGNGSDSFGFTALPAGFCDNLGVFNNLDAVAAFWSSTISPYGINYAWYRNISSFEDHVCRYQHVDEYKHSLRCVLD